MIYTDFSDYNKTNYSNESSDIYSEPVREYDKILKDHKSINDRLLHLEKFLHHINISK
jgi:hypothetical protein